MARRRSHRLRASRRPRCGIQPRDARREPLECRLIGPVDRSVNNQHELKRSGSVGWLGVARKAVG